MVEEDVFNNPLHDKCIDRGIIYVHCTIDIISDSLGLYSPVA